MLRDLGGKPLKVLLIEPVGAYRDVFRAALRRRGIGDTALCATIADAWRYLETEPEAPDWIICTSRPDQSVSIYHLLALLLRQEDLRAIGVSFFADAGSEGLLPGAFELGLMSSHVIEQRTAAAIDEEISALWSLFETHGKDGCAIAAHYYRRYLKAAGDFESLVNFERLMTAIYFKTGGPLLDLAEAHFLHGNDQQGLSAVVQAKLLASDLAERADSLCAKYRPHLPPPLPRSAAALADVFELHSCLVVEPDTSLHRPIAEALNFIGVRDLRFAENGEAASQDLATHPEPGLIVTEWKLPLVPGIGLIQRIRQLNFQRAPVIILSSHVEQKQAVFLREFGVAAVIEKPFAKERFLQQLVAALRSGHGPTGYAVMERRIVAALNNGDLEDARTMKAAFLGARMEIPDQVRALVEARFAFFDGDLKTAHKIVTGLIAKDGDDIRLHDLLGKILLKMGEHEAAVVCFNRAQTDSPENVDRLCSVSEALAELGEYERAKSALESAKKIDGGNPRIIESEARGDLAAGRFDGAARAAFAATTVPMSLVSYMNNRAVAYARSGRHEKCIALYREALGVLSGAHKNIQAVLLFNLAIAEIRQGNVALAQEPLRQASSIANKRLQLKAVRLLAKLTQAAASGVVLTIDPDLHLADKPAASDGHAKKPVAAAFPPRDLSVRAGTHFLFGLVDGFIEDAEREFDLCGTMPKFVRTEALKRGPTNSKRTGYG